MPQSMTGHGAAARSDAAVVVGVELRSVNHRHLAVRFRLPNAAPALEAHLSGLLRARIRRGHVEVRLQVDRLAEALPSLRIDRELASAFHAAFSEVAADLGLAGDIDLELILSQPGVVQATMPADDMGAHAETVGAAFVAALDQLVAAREGEGERLAADLRSRVADLSRLHGELSARAALTLDTRKDRLRARLDDALAGLGRLPDEGRLEQELVYIADKTDISEELTRLSAHLAAFLTALDGEDAPGRKLGFLCQELLREVNTIGSKSADLVLTEHVVAAKVALEKIREQSMNLQ